MFKVETFYNPHRFYEQLQFQNGDLHVTGSESLSFFLKEQIKRKGQDPKGRVNEVKVYSFQKLLTALFPRWHSPLTNLYLASRIRQYLGEKYPVDHKASRLDMHKLVNSLRYLVDLHLPKLESPPAYSYEQEVIIDLYQILRDDEVIQDYLQTREKLSRSELAHRLGMRTVNKIYLYQIYHFDPARILFLHLCRLRGLEVIFRIPYHKDWPEVYKGWEQLYQVVTRSQVGQWQMVECSKVKQGLTFAQYLEGRFAGKNIGDLDGKVKFYTFQQPVDFKSYFQEKQHQEIFMAPVHELLNQGFRDVILSQSRKQDDLKQSPLGRFFLALFKCEREQGKIWMTYDTYVELCTSGLIHCQGTNGTKAISLLVDLEPYMNGVKSLDEITERLSTLLSLQEVSHLFDEQGKQNAGRDRIKQYMSNPFRAFPYVHPQRYPITIKQLLALTKELEKTLHDLLPSHEAIPVSQYLNRIDEKLAKMEQHREESWITPLRQRFQEYLALPWELYKEELYELLSLILQDGDHDETEKHWIHSLEQVDGLTLRNRSIHLTGLSFNHFPHRPIPLEEETYLNHTWLKTVILSHYPKEKAALFLHCLLCDYASRQGMTTFSIFHLYYAVAFAQDSLVLSWIKDWEPDDDLSPYLQVLSELYQSPIKGWQKAEEELSFPEPELKTDAPLQLNRLEGALPLLYWTDYDLCARKFYYTALLQQQPLYFSDFHQRLVFAVIGKSLSQVGEGHQGVEQTLFPLFPQWPAALKRNLIDTEYHGELRDYHQFQNISYPKIMLRLQRLRSRLSKRKKVTLAFWKETQKDKEWLKEFGREAVQGEGIKAEPGSHCRMCPHLLICSEGAFAVDDE